MERRVVFGDVSIFSASGTNTRAAEYNTKIGINEKIITNK